MKKTALVALILGLVSTACASAEPVKSGGASSACAGNNAKIVSMPKASSFPYYDAANVGAKRAAKELGAGFSQVAPATVDAAAQAALIDTQALKQDVCALMISANDPDALNPAVKRARAKGKTVITWDSDITGDKQLYVSQASNEVIGAELVDTLAKQIGRKGKIAYLAGSPTQSNQQAWIKLMDKELEKPENAGIEVVKTVYTEGQDQKATTEIASLLQQYPDLKGMIAPDAVNMPVAARVIKDKDLVGKVALTGLALPSQMRDYVKDGTIETFALWDVEKLGYLSYYAAHALAAGKIKGEPGEVVDAGKAGKFTITENGEVELGPLLWFTKDNVDDFDY
jgi:rhamnose transport system substrate-binding protein